MHRSMTVFYSSVIRTTMVGVVVLSAASRMAASVITNGDFSQGNTGFTTSYTYAPGNIGQPVIRRCGQPFPFSSQ